MVFIVLMVMDRIVMIMNWIMDFFLEFLFFFLLIFVIWNLILLGEFEFVVIDEKIIVVV